MTLEADGLVRTVSADAGADTAAPDRRRRRRRRRASSPATTAYLDLAGRSTAFRIAGPPDVDEAARAAVAHGLVGAAGPADLPAPMPGSVLRVHAAIGQAVAAGDPVVTLEAMKMEHVVVSPIDGRVADLRVRAAEQVTRGQLLAVIEP